MCPNHQDMMRQIILSITTLGLSSMVLGQSIEVVLFQETGLEEATQTALTNYAEQTGVEMTFYEEVLDYSANPGNIQPCAVMDSILSHKDVAIFLGGTKPQHCNWADIVPQLHQFVEDGGTLIFQGPNADGGMAFFFEPEQWEQFDDSPWFGDIDDSQHWCCGLGVENANCGGGQELFGVSHIDHPIFSGAYNYPSGQQGICDMMIFEPSWYSLGAADLNDSRFFSILEFGQALNTDWVHEGEDTQMIFGKTIGAGHVVFYGENNPLPNPYTGSQTLLGNMVVHFSEESGCTNENACNYDPEANVDDGSCLELDACGECGGDGVAGCTVPEACNFNPVATCDDGTCSFAPELELGMDELACEPTIIDAGPGWDSYTWSTSDTAQAIEIFESGTFTVETFFENPNGNVSLSFDGDDHVVFEPQIGDGLNNADFSMSAWIYPEPGLSNGCDGEATTWSSILRRDGAFNLMLYDGRLRAEVFTSDGFVYTETESEVPLESWSFVSAVWEENELSLFIQGQEQSLTNSGQTSFSSPTTSMYVGFSEFYCQGFVGLIHQVQLWGDALTEFQVDQSMSHPLDVDSCELLGLFQGSLGMNGWMLDYAGLQNPGNAEGIGIESITPPLVSPSGCYATDTISVQLNHGSCYCGDGSIWHEETQECLPVVTSENACGDGTEWDIETQSCVIINPSDTNFDGCVSMTDLLDLLSVFGTCNETPWSCGDPLEYQGYDYETVLIGEQCWFAENLRAENYRNGEHIASHDYSTNALEFGVLYRGAVLIADQNVCPAGWSVTSDSDWLELELFLGAESSEVQLFEYSDERLLGFGNELKPSSSNQLGFNAAFGGYLNGPDAIEATDLGVNGQWWTSTFSEDDGNLAIYRNLESWTSGISRIYQPISSYGFSIRCIQDSE